MPDDGDNAKAVDEALRNHACHDAAGRVVFELDLEMARARPRRRGVDLFDGELNAFFIGVAVRFVPRAGGAKSDRARGSARASRDCDK